MKQKPKYKPLLFTTTVRNPQRLKGLLWVLKKFNTQVLDNDLATKIVGEAIRYGLYRPTNIPTSVNDKWRGSDNGGFAKFLLTEDEVSYIMVNNPQNHKEAEFDFGYPSRFATFYTFARTLGFVYFKIGEKIEFSDLGNLYASILNVSVDESGNIMEEEIHPEYEQQVFLHAMCKYQRNNPFLRVLNENVPLILLLQTIKLLNADEQFNNCGISRMELPLLIFWKNSDSEGLYKRIKTLRSEYGYNPSDEVVINICLEEIMAGSFKKFNPKSIVDEYPDEFIRKMRLTGLISLRGAGRFIDINHAEDDKIEYILNRYSSYDKFSDERKYFDYVSLIDNNLLSIKPKIDVNDASRLLKEWLTIFSWDKIKSELEVLSKKQASRDDVLKFLPSPARLEFLTALAIKSKFPNIDIRPNYPCDDTGLPTSTAGGNAGDIECVEDVHGILVEVTMAEGRTQTMMEIWPIERHLESFKEKVALDSECIFVAPSIFADSYRQCEFVKFSKNHDIRPLKIAEFVQYLENAMHLYADTLN